MFTLSIFIERLHQEKATQGSKKACRNVQVKTITKDLVLWPLL